MERGGCGGVGASPGTCGGGRCVVLPATNLCSVQYLVDERLLTMIAIDLPSA